jgi:hypothetical protein
MDERQKRVLISTHARVVMNRVRFKTISGAITEIIYEKSDRHSSLISLNNSRKAVVTIANHLPLRVHDHPIHIAPVSQHPRWRTTDVIASVCATPCVHHHSLIATNNS